MYSPNCLLALLLLLASTAWAPAARALDTCVDTGAELVAALDSWEGMPDGSSLRIQIVQGSYPVGNTLGRQRWTQDREVSLSLLGGYSAGCTGRVVSAANTVLDGQGQAGQEINFAIAGNADVHVEGITFRNFVTAQDTLLSVVPVWDHRADGASATVRHCRFIDNTVLASPLPDLSGVVYLNLPLAQFVNNLVAWNSAPAGTPAVRLRFVDDDGRAVANNNTIAWNASAAGGLALADAGFRSALTSEVADNILWANGSGIDFDLSDYVEALSPIQVYNNIIGHSLAFTPNSTNLASNPGFVNAGADDFTLQNASPAINSGAYNQVNGFPARDLSGGERIVGSRIDRGAHESAVDDLTAFTVTTIVDNGSNTAPVAGSLRAAVKAANAAGGPFTIRFNIPGSGPHLLTLSGAMLDIVGDVTIDGTTQPGTVQNASTTQFQAVLKLAVNGAGSTPYAFRVPATAPNARLTLRGFMLAGFSEAAVKLEGGSQHRIQGNQFGAVPFAAANARAIWVSGNAQGTFIGGYDAPEFVNLIAGSSGAGILLDNAGGHGTVASNLIGFQPNGASPAGNLVGIQIQQSPGNQIQYNRIGHNGGQGIALLGNNASTNSLQYNTIGIDANDQAAGNGGAGVMLSLGAHHNTVGAILTAAFGGNRIANNNGGVWVTPTGSVGNAILGNRIHHNGTANIDLGDFGPTPNQVVIPATGPNRLQNHPLMIDVAPAAGSTKLLRVELTAQPFALYRIDIYSSDACGERGEAGAVVAHFNLSTDATGVGQQTSAISVDPGHGFVSGTATNSDGNTSELGPCIAVPSAQSIFTDGFE